MSEKNKGNERVSQVLMLELGELELSEESRGRLIKKLKDALLEEIVASGITQSEIRPLVPMQNLRGGIGGGTIGWFVEP